MKELVLPAHLSKRIGELYSLMGKIYADVAVALDFSCNNCPDNCCDSYFQHHTYIEWAYLWQGLRQLPDKELRDITAKALSCMKQSERDLARGVRPLVMCPLNRDGLCSLYGHRMMICRLHGVPATLTRQDGKILRFPGCFRCQEKIQNENTTDCKSLERFSVYRHLADLEIELLGQSRQLAPKVNFTLAQMIVFGPPALGGGSNR